MTLTEFIDNFGATLDKGEQDSAKDFSVIIEFEWDGQTLSLEPEDVTFKHNDREVVISVNQ